MNKEILALAITESENDTAQLTQIFDESGYYFQLQEIDSVKALGALLQIQKPDLVFLEYPHSTIENSTAFDLLTEMAPNVPVVVISEKDDAKIAVEVMRSGAKDFFVKGEYDRLVPAIERLMGIAMLSGESATTILGLEENEPYFQNIVDNAPVAIAIYTQSGIRYANRTALELIGATTPDDVLGRSYLDFLHPEDHKFATRLARQAWKRSMPPVEERMVCLDGESFDAEIVSGPITYEGKKAIIIIFMDISERVRSRRASRRRLSQIQVAAEIARDATAAKSTEELLNSAVTLVHERFGYYHAAIFLIDEQNKYAVIVATRSEAGKKLLELGHKLEVGKVGIVGHVAATGEARIALDVGVDAVHFRQPLLLETRSEISLPLIVDNRVIGVLDVQSRDEAAFDRQDIEVLSIMADQLAVAIDKARLLAEVNRRANELRGLYDAALATSSELDADSLLNRLYEQVQLLIAPDTFLLALLEPDEDEIYIAVVREGGKSLPSMEGQRYPISDGGLTGWVIRNRQTLLCDDLIEDTPPVLPIFDPQSIAVTRSWLGVPLIVQNRVIGVASIQSFQPYAFDEEQKKFFEMLAAQAVIAFENARLFKTVEIRASELEALRQVNLKLTASLESQDVHAAILDGVVELMPDARSAQIFTYDGGQLTFGSSLRDDGKNGKVFSAPQPNGLTSSIAQNGKMIVVPDTRDHHLFEDIPEEMDWTGSIVGLPLKIGDRVVGVMNVSFQDPRTFSEDELRILRLLGDQAAFGIENANLYKQANLERRSIALLYDIGRVLSQSLDPKIILEQAAILTCQAMEGTSGVTLFLDEERKWLLPAAIYNAQDDALLGIGIPLALGEGLAGWVAKEQQAANIPDVRQDERWYYVPSTDKGVLSAISAPIIEESNVIGTLSVHHNQINAFADDQIDLMDAICQQISLAHSNALRYQEINRLVTRLGAQQNRLESLIRELPIGLLLFDGEYRLVNANVLGQEYLSSLATIDVGDQLSNVGTYSFAELLEHQDNLLPIEVSLEESPRRKFELQVRSVVGDDAYEWLLAIRDVTREREIQERVQMQDRLATVGQLAAGIAHDFNNIMAAIVIYADLLKLDSGLSSASKEKLAVIQKQIQRASSLIRQILDFSRRSVMEQTEMDLLPFMKEIEKLLQRMLPETIQTKLNFEVGDYRVFVDSTRMQQVIMNLALNARDAMPNGGNIRFELAPRLIDEGDDLSSIYLTPGEWIRISVIDTGSGIPAENLQRIFEPFFTTKDVGKGTGLGLAQVYGIVKQHGGYIDVDSKLEEGTAFHIYLPKLSDKKETKKKVLDVEQVDMDGGGRLVVLAEDDAPTRAAVKAMLEACQFKVLTAMNGLDALKILESEANQTTLVISDVVMPLLGGVELHEQVKWRWPEIKVLFITGHPLEGKARKLLSTGEISWLQKPFTVHQLQQAIQSLLEDP